VCTGPLQADGSCPPPGTPDTSRCSGTLVAPNLVLTARHCVEHFDSFASDDFCSAAFNGELIHPEIQVTPSNSVLQAGAVWYAVQEIHTPPGDNNCTDDLALLELAENVRGVLPAGIDLYRDLAKRPPARVAIVGRGAIAERYDPETGEQVEFDTGGSRRRRLERIPFVCASNTDGVCSVEDIFSVESTFNLPAGLFAYGPSGASGDSGAGVFAQGFFDFGLFLAIGINTLGTVGEDGDLSGSQGVRLSRHADFLRATAATAAASGWYPVPLWAR
jgi:hypothetical protein